jgi:hypothetical protein
MAKQIKLTKIPVGTILALQELADRRGCSIERVLQDAVNTEFDINERLEEGCEILCKNNEGEVRRLVFTHMNQ